MQEKSTMVQLLAEKHNGIACKENYHNQLLDKMDAKEFPNLTYIRDIKDWRDFIRRTPDQYEAWIDGCNRECTIIEQQILSELAIKNQNKKIFVDTNITLDVLHKISDKDHVLIMLADPEIKRFFERPDKEKQFLYQLLLKEDDPQKAMDNFRECLKRINSIERYNEFKNSGFNVITREDNRTIEKTLNLAEKYFKLI